MSTDLVPTELVSLMVRAESIAVPGQSLRPQAMVLVTTLGDSPCPVVHISHLNPAAYPASVGKHSDRVQIRRALGDSWAYCRIVGAPDDAHTDLLRELVDVLQENQL